jgi:hypothetical protein
VVFDYQTTRVFSKKYQKTGFYNEIKLNGSTNDCHPLCTGMQSALDDGYRSIDHLTQHYQQRAGETSTTQLLLSHVVTIRNFYQYISRSFLDSSEDILTKSVTTRRCPPRLILLVRRASRTLRFVSCHFATKLLKELVIMLHDLILECKMAIDLMNQNLSNHDTLECEKLEYKMQYEQVLYEREIAMPKANMDFSMERLNPYLEQYVDKRTFSHVNTLLENVKDFLQARDIHLCLDDDELKRALIQVPLILDILSLDFPLDERDSITRESIRNKLAEDRPVSEPLDEHVLHRITRKEVLLQNEAKTEKITDIIKRCQWIVFLGDPGSGKSTLMRFLAQYHADHLLNPETSKQGTHRIPVAVRLSSFAEKCAANESLSLLDYIYATKKLMAKVLERC